MFKDYYQILGISPTATSEEIKQAYRSLSKKWHPDHNPNQDVTSIMQDINEAYFILKNDSTRASYDIEYNNFIQQGFKRKSNSKTVEETPNETDIKDSPNWTYEYEVKDEKLKEDIRTAREQARDLVKDFFKNIHETSKTAVKGAWEGCKPYVYVFAFLMLFGVIVRLCSGDNSRLMAVQPKLGAVVDTLSSFHSQKPWTKHSLYNGAFTILVPPTVELRKEEDLYSQRLKQRGFVDPECVIFQQKGLSTTTDDTANDHYCRIMIAYSKDKDDDYLHCNESEYLSLETKKVLREAVIQQLGGYSLLAEPQYRWICIHQNVFGGTNAIEIRYRRSASDNYTTSCIMYFLYNYNEMVQLIVSYREQEKELWLPDFEDIIKTLYWNKDNFKLIK
jgi:hypothetical protein